MMVCEACTNSVLSFLLFKQRISRYRQNISLRLVNVKKAVNFLVHSKEELVVLKYDQSMLLVPASQKNFVTNRIYNETEPNVESRPQPKGTAEYKESHDELEEDDLLVEIPENQSYSLAKTRTVSAKLEVFTVDCDGNLTKDEPIRLRASKDKKKRGRPRKPDPFKDASVKQEPRSGHESDQLPLVDSKKGRKLKRRKAFVAGTSNSDGRPKNESQVLLSSLSPEQQKQLAKAISASRVDHSSYRCVSCSKVLSSKYAVRYHIVSMHFLEKDEAKMWVKKRLEEARTFQSSYDSFMFMNKKWKCVECARVFNSEQALRAHLHLHLNESNEAWRSSSSANSIC